MSKKVENRWMETIGSIAAVIGCMIALFLEDSDGGIAFPLILGIIMLVTCLILFIRDRTQWAMLFLGISVFIMTIFFSISHYVDISTKMYIILVFIGIIQLMVCIVILLYIKGILLGEDRNKIELGKKYIGVSMIILLILIILLSFVMVFM